MNLEIRFGGVVVNVEVQDADVAWEAARKIAESHDSQKQRSSPLTGVMKNDVSSPKRVKSKTDQIREIAKWILADGKVHERREIAKAVRDAGLNPQIIGRALEHSFEKGQNVLGRPTYRNPAARTPEPMQMVGSLSTNGGDG